MPTRLHIMEHKIHVAFGFHVNCYHSYRGDTNDGLGFGSDIRIIRKTLDVLNRLNEEGIPVKGTWDCENFFSLEKILPEYAPDILERMRERVEKYGDAQIIMGYSNGALSAMNEAEFTASIEKAVTNPEGSGLADLFGKYEMIVRPQEVMFTPSQVCLYNKLGIEAVCLYYSCVPFDAFRTIVPELPDELAFNPLTYTYKGESITVLPTYNNSDICDAGCLRSWVTELHKKQLTGEIDRDLFLFINMDADAIFWESFDLPVIGNRIANTDGIHGLVKEVADLDFIVFDTPGGYLQNHEPLGKIEFTQDTADGNFTGYASWAEKPYNRKIWTAIERGRAMAKVNAGCDTDAPSFRDRVLLLSTTHFGLATPVLNIRREKKADELAEKIIEAEKKALPKAENITVCNTNGTALQCAQFRLKEPLADVSQLHLEGDSLTDYAAISMNDSADSIFAVMQFCEIRDRYEIRASVRAPRKAVCGNALKAGNLEIRFFSTGKIYSVCCGGKEIGKSDFLRSFITYDGKSYTFESEHMKPLSCAGNGTGLRISGDIHLPGEISGGHFVYDFFTVPCCDAVFLRTDVQYPYTPENTSISTENSVLGRYSDMKWQEAAMTQFTPRLGDDPRVVKRNFFGDISEFRTASFGECDDKNRALDSFNHQLTAGIVGLSGSEHTLILANARQVLNSMAYCPMRLNADGTVHMNPFGTYYGKQRHHRGRAKDEVLNVYTLVTPQGKSIAPAYNGNHECAMLALFAFPKGNVTPDDLSAAIAFADGAVIVSPEDALLQPFYADNVTFKDTKAQSAADTKLRNPILTGISGNLPKYIKNGGKAILHIIRTQLKTK